MTQNKLIDIPSLEDFPLWLKDRIDVDINSSHMIHDNNAIVQMKEQLLPLIIFHTFKYLPRLNFLLRYIWAPFSYSPHTLARIFLQFLFLPLR